MKTAASDPLSVLRNLGQGTPGRVVRPMGEPADAEEAALTPRRAREPYAKSATRVVGGYTIEKSEPLPELARPTKDKTIKRAAALDALEVGEHFTVTGVRTQEALHTPRRYLKEQGTLGTRKFVTRPVPGGVRIWRKK